MEKSISIVGCGIKFLQQITQESILKIKNSDIIFTLVADPLTIIWLKNQNENIVILNNLYSESTDRKETYYSMVEVIIKATEKYNSVCVVSYGHPGVFAFPLHETIRQAKKLGIDAVMLPGISAEDCLFADLNVDPGSHGCLSYEATDFLIHGRVFDVYSHLVLWQIGVIGIKEYRKSHDVWNRHGVKVLGEYLSTVYDINHECYIYEAAIYNIMSPQIKLTTIGDVHKCDISAISTLYIPPVSQPKPDMDMLNRLQISDEDVIV